VDRRVTEVVRLATPEWRTVDIGVERPRNAHVLVELQVNRTFVPSRGGSSHDDRTVGVMVGEVEWRDG
jgi:hypothetical protein